MSIRSRVHLCLVFLPAFSILCAAVLFAQQKPPAIPISRIDLDVVVTPKSGPPVANLQQQDFTVIDNKTQQKITSFHAVAGSQQSIHIVLVIDAVNSSYENIAYQREQMDKFLRANGGHLPQPIALAFFTDTGTEMQHDFSTDGNALSASLDKYTIGLRNIHRSSQFQASDRFQLSINAIRALAAQVGNLPGRKMIFWVSPGWPLLSGPGVELDARQQNEIFSTVVGFSTQLRQTRTTLYGIDPLGSGEGLVRTFFYKDFLKGVSKPGQVSLADLSLQVLAVQSGGLALSSSNDVAALLQNCMADTEAYYEISFQAAPAEHRDEYHTLEVQVATPGLTARTRTGYYAQP